MIDLTEAAMKIYGKTKNDDPAAEEAPEDQRVIFPQEGAEEIVAKYGAEEEERELTPDEIRYAIPLTKEGEESAQWYADRYVETGDYRYAVGGLVASLWTPETADKTMMVLQASRTPIMEAARPFFRYLTAKSKIDGPWLTRGPDREPPYGENFQLAKDKLQIPNEVTGVVEVRPKWYEPIRGPRTVDKKVNRKYGTGGGEEYHRGWRWPKDDE